MLAQPPVLLLYLLERPHGLDESLPSLPFGSHFEHGQRVAMAGYDDKRSVGGKRIVQTPYTGIEVVRDRFQRGDRAVRRALPVGDRLVVPLSVSISRSQSTPRPHSQPCTCANSIMRPNTKSWSRANLIMLSTTSSSVVHFATLVAFEPAPPLVFP